MKIRNGFVSNSSSSSFVLFGTCVDNSLINKITEESIIQQIKEKYGDNIPTETGDRWGLLHDYIEMNKDKDYLDDMCPYEKSEICGFSEHCDEFYLGFSPVWFRSNPTKTWDDAVEKFTAKYIKMGIPKDDISFGYVKECSYNG